MAVGGETCESYKDVRLKAKGNSTPSQTAWALIGLIDAVKGLPALRQNLALETAIAKGIQFLVNRQTADGSWDEVEFTGTGFPCHFYIRYHYYRQYFPLITLARYQSLITGTSA